MARSTEGSPTMRRAPERSKPRRWDPSQHSSGPWGLMRQMQDQMDRWFSRSGLGGSWGSPFTSMSRAAGAADWTPAVDAFQRGNEFVIRADVPGMNRNDLSVEIGDDSITIRGERKHDEHGEDEGIYWSERSYGTFYRVVPLPPGAIADSAKAKFSTGVLEITVQAPSSEMRRGRKIDISGGG
jgi:HSP20 family protein